MFEDLLIDIFDLKGTTVALFERDFSYLNRSV
jgi:hypothetical protein